MSDENIKSTIKIRKWVLARDQFNIGYYTHVPINVHVRYIRQCYIAICDIAQNILKHSKRNGPLKHYLNIQFNMYKMLVACHIKFTNILSSCNTKILDEDC